MGITTATLQLVAVGVTAVKEISTKDCTGDMLS